ncbi:molybdopterin-binding protein [Asticcacaulis currens]|uniref:Molybdenum cofactor biosynthesis protein B n=1 Tax=Asticcacaulis currens TaxID=2984210 RepID=A0ABT5IB34_9CAUL|nr:molybdopterin-binding protein [Asticcacaulis currens]MDC7693392.1 molybdopterin-binding protein [Asticcacaulis currens]
MTSDKCRVSACILNVTRNPQGAPTEAMRHLSARLVEAGYEAVEWGEVVSEAGPLRSEVKRRIASPDCRVLVLLGGTGPNPDDITPEALETILEKRFDGFSVLFHVYSHASAGLPGLLSRAVAGIANGTCVLALPASLSALRDIWDNLLFHHLSLDPDICSLVRAGLRAEKKSTVAADGMDIPVDSYAVSQDKI